MSIPFSKSLILFLIFLFSFQISFTQLPSRCEHESKTEIATGTEYAAFMKMAQAEKQVYLKSFKDNQVESSSAIITIPVHVIIVHPPGQPVGSGANLSLPHILSQITVLNQDFRRQNSDAGNTPPVFAAADSEIEFCMASIDPNGQATDGVTRYGTNQNLNSNEFAIKSATGWDRNQYLNVWVGENTGALGWAYLATPSSLPNATLDGIVVETGAFGGPGFAWLSPYDLGRTATHEVGHFLGLYHVWGGGGCSSDDGMADTPMQNGPNWGCPNHPHPSCGNGGDMFMNYMDYVDDNCMNAFSVDQAAWMNTILGTSRASLAGSANTVCSAPPPPPLGVVIVSQSDVKCFGGNDGEIEVLATGGVPAFQYSLNGGAWQSSGLFQNLPAGNYSIDVQDSDGTIVNIQVPIGQPDPISQFVTAQGNVSCFGSNDGFISVSASGGIPFSGNVYQYSLNGTPYSNQSTFTSLNAGIYVLGTLDANDCEVFMDVEIFQPEELLVEVDELTDVDCFGNENGSVQLFVEGGTQDYMYSLDGTTYQEEDFFENLTPGEYTASVLDFNDCLAEIEFTIVEPEELELNISHQTEILCNGDETASVTLEPLGGTADFEYSLDNENFQADPIFEDLGAGNYLFYVLDANGCESEVETDIEEPEILELELVSQNIIPCAGEETGEFSVEAFGGTPGYLYTLPDGTTSNDGFFENLAAGIYEVQVEDINGCLVVMEVELTEMPALSLNVISQNDVSCFGGNNGTAFVEATGGNGDYQYSIDGINYFPAGNFEELLATTYTVFVLDNEGCLSETNLTIGEPPMIEPELISSIDPECFETNTGSLEIMATGGVGNFTYTLGDDSNSNGVFENLSAGTYEIEILDGNDCSEIIQATLTDPENLTLTLSAMTEPDCFGSTNGILQLNGSGGKGIYSFSLGNETNTTGNFEDLEAGIYSVELTDENDCTTNQDFEITQPTAVQGEIVTVVDAGCSGAEDGSIEVIGTGGVGDFEYTLNGETNSTGLFENLIAGNYLVQVNDGNNCQTEIQATIEEGADIDFSASQISDVLCNGESNGTVQLNAIGGAGNFEYFVNNQMNMTGYFESLPVGNYLASATDSESCVKMFAFSISEPEPITPNVSDIQNVECSGGETGSLQANAMGGVGVFEYTLNGETNSTGNFGNLSAGDYEVIITDENGCVSIAEAFISEPTPINLDNADIQNVTCSGMSDGSLQLVTSGGIGVHTYTLGNETNSTGNFENLSANNYTIIITDENGCENPLVMVIDEPDPLFVNVVNIQNVSCKGGNTGSFEVQAEGGVGDYQFEMDGETNTTGIFENLSEGDYEILISDGNGCQTNAQVVIIQNPELVPEVISSTNVLCHDESNGVIQLGAIGGAGNYSYILDNEMNTSGLFEGLSAGNYEIMVLDDSGCEALISIELTEPMPLTSEILDQEDLICFEEGTGLIQVQAIGGTSDYQYDLNGEVNNTGLFENLFAGIHEVIIIDQNGCETLAQTELSQPDELILNATNIQKDNGTGNGSFSIEAAGGTQPYLISPEPPFENLTTGFYTVLVTDANGCEEEITVEIQLETAVVDLESGIQYLGVMPNPFDESIFVKMNILSGQKLEMSLLNIQGQQIEYFEEKFGSGEHLLKYEVKENLPSGTYIFNVRSERSSYFFKLIKR